MDTFTLTVTYKGTERNYNASLRVLGYTHKIAVEVEGVEILFEPDEERNYRAILHYEDVNHKKADAGLCKAIAEELEASLK